MADPRDHDAAKRAFTMGVMGSTLDDCAAEHLPPELLRSAALDALARGLVARRELAIVEAALSPFGGLRR
jgi:hypothetical protein